MKAISCSLHLLPFKLISVPKLMKIKQPIAFHSFNFLQVVISSLIMINIVWIPNLPQPVKGKEGGGGGPLYHSQVRGIEVFGNYEAPPQT